MKIYVPIYETNEILVTSSNAYKKREDAVKEINNRKYQKRNEEDTFYTRRDRGFFRPNATAYVDELTLI